MTKIRGILILAAALLIAGCTGQTPQPNASATEVTIVDNPVALETTAPVETAPEEVVTECPGDEINPIGESIAADYDFTNYDQVMTWFCEGAEFEDIMVALETQDATGEPAGDLLQMLADGLTWDDIWLLVGLSN